MSSATPTEAATDLTIVGNPRSYIVSEWEKETYYNGVTTGDGYIPLLYRSNYDTDPWPPPQPPTLGSFGHLPSKHVVDIYGTSLAPVWRTVGPLILELVKQREFHGADRSLAVDPARFIKHDMNDGKETLSGPVVWIAVPYNSTTPDTAHDVTESILSLLAQHSVRDAVVEWREGELCHLSGPTLMPSVARVDPTAELRHDFTAALNLPLYSEEAGGEGSEGSLTLYFHEVKDKDGNPSDKVLAVSNCHLIWKDTTIDYTFDSLGAGKLFVRVMGPRRFEQNLTRIQEAVRSSIEEMHLLANELKRLDGTKIPESTLHMYRSALAAQEVTVPELENFQAEVKREWTESEKRNIGYVRCAKAVKVDNYTEDWCAIELDEAKFKEAFEGTFIDLGTMSREKLNRKCHLPEDTGATYFTESCKLRIHDVAHPDFLDNLNPHGDDACLIVGKDGTGSGLTFGRYAGRVSFVCDKLGTPSTELAIYNSKLGRDSGVFARKGDSGALVWDGNGRAIGQLHSGWRGPSTNCHICYATPAWWLLECIKKEFPHAAFFQNTWTL